MTRRENHDEGRTLARPTVRGDCSTMPLHDFPADREPDPGPFILVAAVQPLEDLEDPLAILLVKTNPIIPDRQIAKRDRVLAIPVGSWLTHQFTFNLYHRRHARSMKFQGIDEQVLE